MRGYQGLGGAEGKGECLPNGYRVSTWDDEKVSEIEVVMGAQHCECNTTELTEHLAMVKLTNFICIFPKFTAAATAKSLQSCLTLCDPRDSSPPGSAILGILQARTLEWVAISFSNAWKWKVKVKSPSRVQLLATPWSEAYQAPPSMGFSRQEYWSGVSLPSPFHNFMEF